MDVKNLLLSQHSNVRQLTLEVAAAMPDERYEFTPWEGSFSFGDSLRHIASIEKALIQALLGGGWDWNQGVTRDAYPNRAAIEALLRESGEALREEISRMSNEAFTRPIASPWGDVTPAELLLLWLIHEAHHRGQLYVHLRLNGITPPTYH
ncbi:DinB family protein [Hydrogenibacillus sp. N12]|uniref:DinB family protein n=1 Tax=Hydrogenibacillus sp. N12 TaxID=2866627 RepID=UPI001C7CB32F|nr:DinB family protein [Hydrogenibacillus sp. N12]QZA33835.1 DinB family protein [Hydrogenibacillus sp. N12]